MPPKEKFLSLDPRKSSNRGDRILLTSEAPRPARTITSRGPKKTNGPLTGRGTFNSGGGKRKRPLQEEESDTDGEPPKVETQVEDAALPVRIKKEGERKFKPKAQTPSITQIVGIDNGMSGSGKSYVESAMLHPLTSQV